MSTNSAPRFRTVARMDRRCFNRLVEKLKSTAEMQDGEFICVGEKLMILMQVLVGLSLRQIAERFQHSISTISIIVHEVCNAFCRIESTFFIQPVSTSPVPDCIRNDVRRADYFTQCIGALDGTFIPAIVPVSQQNTFRNRKGFISQNVLGVGDFDIVFTNVLTGWEGCTSRSLR